MATISNYRVLVGNLIIGFKYVTMAKVLLVPNEEARDKVHQALQNNLIAIRRELDTALARDDPWGLLPEKLLEAWGHSGLVDSEVDLVSIPLREGAQAIVRSHAELSIANQRARWLTWCEWRNSRSRRRRRDNEPPLRGGIC